MYGFKKICIKARENTVRGCTFYHPIFRRDNILEHHLIKRNVNPISKAKKKQKSTSMKEPARPSSQAELKTKLKPKPSHISILPINSNRYQYRLPSATIGNDTYNYMSPQFINSSTLSGYMTPTHNHTYSYVNSPYPNKIHFSNATYTSLGTCYQTPNSQVLTPINMPTIPSNYNTYSQELSIRYPPSGQMNVTQASYFNSGLATDYVDYSNIQIQMQPQSTTPISNFHYYYEEQQNVYQDYSNEANSG